ncbi:MAG: AAA family ATPase, partial [Phycisphaerae bacterium]|nr:AAA family ATPase [Phycisphaerae bacterium]
EILKEHRNDLSENSPKLPTGGVDKTQVCVLPTGDVDKSENSDLPTRKNGNSTNASSKTQFKSIDDIFRIMQDKHGGELEALHEYHNPDGTHNQYVIRWRGQDTKKYIWPCVHTPAGYELRFPESRVLYRLPTLADAKTVIVLEGEFKTDILAGYGFPATTSSGGSKAAGRTDWRPLAGKNVILWPDYDTPGKGYADDVKRILEGLGCRVKIIHPSELDLAVSEDAKDYIDQLRNAKYNELEIKENLTRVFARAKSTGAGQEVVSVLSSIAAGQYEPIETGFHTLDDVMQILPGSLNLVCGSPGSSKSLLMLQLAARWYREKIKTAVFELEKDRVFHLRRALAQESGLAMLTNNKWTKRNAELAQKTALEHLDWMDNFGRMIFAYPEKIIYQRDVIEWTRQRADAGCRAVVIDPATKAERQDEPYKADGLFVQQLAQIATMTRLVIFLVLHPTKSLVAMPDLSQIAGGASYGRFADNAVWLENHEAKTSSVKTCCGTTDTQHDRTLWILKSRDGAGTGSRIAFKFNNDNLTLRELGKIDKRKKGNE